MQKILTVKGTKDLFGEDIFNHDEVIRNFSEICNFFSYQKISTPIIEHSSIFEKSLGLTSDIISKEMYSFVDKGGDSIVLRPEGTAAISRALISNSLQEKNLKKFFYYGPMFRREKPQHGRMRQFHQVGVENFAELNFLCDLEVILIAEMLIKKLDIKDKLKLEINSLGNSEARKRYEKKLVEFLNDYKKDLSDESQKRLINNPLRILDSKSLIDQKITAKAPIINDFLDEESLDFFQNLTDGLKKLDISFKIYSNLVRGLDYYNHTSFEYKTFSDKSQNTVLAGGRYDGLVKSLGGKNIGGVGWAAGVERILINLPEKNIHKKIITFFSVDNKTNNLILQILKNLKLNKFFSVNFLNTGNLKKKFEKADKVGSLGCVFLSEYEWKKNMLIWKDLKTGKQENFEISKINDFLIEKLTK